MEYVILRNIGIIPIPVLSVPINEVTMSFTIPVMEYQYSSPYVT